METPHVTTLFGDPCAKQFSVLELPFEQLVIIGCIMLKQLSAACGFLTVSGCFQQQCPLAETTP